MTDTPRPTAGGLTWDQCLSVAYEGCAEVLAKRVQELERDLAAAESRGYVRAMREAAELARASMLSSSGWASAEWNSACSTIADALDDMAEDSAQEVDRGA